jgi:hypothetical protein
MKLFISLLFILLTAYGCGPTYVQQPPTINLLNNTDEFIAEVVAKDCATEKEKVIAQNIRPHTHVAIRYPTNCSDIAAYNRQKEIIGRQINISTPPPLDWKINN